MSSDGEQCLAPETHQIATQCGLYSVYCVIIDVSPYMFSGDEHTTKMYGGSSTNVHFDAIF